MKVYLCMFFLVCLLGTIHQHYYSIKDSSNNICYSGFFSNPLIVSIVAIALHTLVIWIYRKPKEPVPIFVVIDEKVSKAKVVLDGETRLIYKFSDQNIADYVEEVMRDLEGNL